MLISKIPNLPTYSLVNTQQPEHKLTGWTLKWKQKQLLVKARKSRSHHAGLDIEDEQWLQECLQKSPVKIIQIDPAVGTANLKIWATACKAAKKTMFLRTRTSQKLPYLYPVRWRLKRGCDLVAATSLVVTLSPVILGLMSWTLVKSPQSPIFIRQWHIGQRGQLFQLLKFNCLIVGHNRYWKNLPQLFNVLRGEMSLVGARPRTLTEVRYLQPEQINALPGITGIPKIKSSLLKSSSGEVHLDYLNTWSLSKDLKILLQTALRIFSNIH
jgi:lipopolysaccharide/colanic/teichoic acid biosynthesis glycosyltransferase